MYVCPFYLPFVGLYVCLVSLNILFPCTLVILIEVVCTCAFYDVILYLSLLPCDPVLVPSVLYDDYCPCDSTSSLFTCV